MGETQSRVVAQTRSRGGETRLRAEGKEMETDTNEHQRAYRKRGGWKQNGERNGMRKVEETEWESGRDQVCAGQSGIPAQTGGLHIISPPLKSGPSPVQAWLCGDRRGGVG